MDMAHAIHYSRLLIVLVISTLFLIVPAAKAQRTQLFFHGSLQRTDLSLFGVGSAELVYEWADLSPPSRPLGSPEQVTLSSKIKGDEVSRLGIRVASTKSPDGRDVFFAYAAWLTPPLVGIEEARIDGKVMISAWMSSLDPLASSDGSGYFFAIAEVNPRKLEGAIFLWYDYKAGFGDLLGNAPRLFSTEDFGRTFEISHHVFETGSSLAFFVGAGSTLEGWRFSVHFDSPDRASSALVPLTEQNIDEYPGFSLTLIALTIWTASYLLRRTWRPTKISVRRAV